MKLEPGSLIEPTKRVALLLHGNSGCSKDMSHLAELLSQKGYFVLNCDLPLHGKHRKFAPPLSIDNCALYFADILSSYHKNPITLLGYSDGANVILKLLQLGLPNISQVVLISPNSRASEIGPAWRFVFVFSRLALFSIAYIPALRRVYRRIGMMTKYHLDLSLLRVPENTILIYAENDLILKRDQVRIAEALRQQSRTIGGVDHFSILKSDGVRKIVVEEMA